jgi:hypothetical protein
MRVAKLEGLLARVQARAKEPRPIAMALAGEPVAELDEPQLDEPDIDDIGESGHDIDDIDDLEDMQEIEDVDLDEPGAPESGPVSARTMDDAIDEAAHQPPLTPPPESGEEVASPHIPAHPGPTMEQLGETISLEEGQARDFELDEPTLEVPEPETPPSQMEADIPSAPPAQLQVPETAREDLERVRLGDSTPIEARVMSRPMISTNVVDLVSSSRDFRPKSFLDLVDASLGLK